MSSSDSLTTSSTGTPPSSSIHSISLLELDIHFLKLNPASFLFFILDLAFFVQLKCFRDAVFPLIEVIYIEVRQSLTNWESLASYLVTWFLIVSFGRKGELVTPNTTRSKRFTTMLDFHYQYHLSKESAKHLGQLKLLGCAAKATRWYLKRINTSGMSESNEGPA